MWGGDSREGERAFCAENELYVAFRKGVMVQAQKARASSHYFILSLALRSDLTSVSSVAVFDGAVVVLKISTSISQGFVN
ncbi:hypothetical protein cyc_05858 [Cyclospora cayetanensis]|uniref:Uncharacterized protein n=1 Tax=Cyclospora cayetanensis TaxID=88456 RepID=A0A1D3CRV5_9EIME|nr:hypothetical protein cyc_05858 [Cyclospora cayetanensis]